MTEREQQLLLPAGTYILIWFGLLAFTGLTVTAAALQLGNLSVIAAIGIALVKSWLVVFYFMNLKQEPRLFKLMLILCR